MASPTSAIEVRVHQTNGQSISGELQSLTEKELVIGSRSEPTTVSLDGVLRIDRITKNSQPPSEAGDTTSGRLRVQLTDGSEFSAAEFRLDGRQAELSFAKNGGNSGASMESLQVEKKQIRSVHFQSMNDELTEQWNEIADSPHEGDAVVIRKNNTLDYLDGIIQATSPEHVQFDFDGDTLDIPLRKLQAVLFFQTSATEPPAAPTVVRLTNGDRWNVSRILVNPDGQFTLNSIAGVEVTLPIDQLKAIDYGGGKLVYVSSLNPLREVVAPVIRIGKPNPLQIRLLYAPRRDEGFESQPLQLKVAGQRQPQVYSNGLALHSRTELEYRLSSQFRRLKGIVGIDPVVASHGAVQLTILADSQVLFDELINGQTGPMELDLDVAKKKRLTISVDVGDGMDHGDRLNMCELRLIK